MFAEFKSKILKGSIFISILCIIIGLGLAGWNATDAFYSVAGYKDFTQLKPEEIKSQLVKVDLTENFGSYLEEQSKNTKTGSVKTTHLYYIIWTGDDNAEDWRYMTIKVPARYEKQMDAMTENTYNEIRSEAIPFTGKIKKLDNEEYSYFKSTLKELGLSDADIQTMTLPYYIDYGDQTAMTVLYLLLFGAGMVLLIYGIFRLAKAAGGSSLKKLRQDIAAAGYTEAAVEADYREAQSYDKKGILKVGRLMTYYIAGSNARAIPNAKMIWAYQTTVTHRTNGVKTGTTYNIMIFDELTPKGHTFPVANESIAKDMLTHINATLPWVVAGYSDELKKLYNKDRTQFLQLRYNTCEHVAAAPFTEQPAPDNQG